VLGVTHLDGGQQGIKKTFLYHGFSREGVLLSETGEIFTATYELESSSDLIPFRGYAGLSQAAT
jgi:hypothetical protein